MELQRTMSAGGELQERQKYNPKMDQWKYLWQAWGNIDASQKVGVKILGIMQSVLIIYIQKDVSTISQEGFWEGQEELT